MRARRGAVRARCPDARRGASTRPRQLRAHLAPEVVEGYPRQLARGPARHAVRLQHGEHGGLRRLVRVRVTVRVRVRG